LSVVLGFAAYALADGVFIIAPAPRKPCHTNTIIQPKEGLSAAFVKPPGRNQFFETNEELPEFLLKTSQSSDAYHARATFKVAGSRKVDNVAKLKPNGIDIDLKPGIGLSTPAMSFCELRASQDPYPCIRGADYMSIDRMIDNWVVRLASYCP
jgi:hypothetical protein